jgi:hypothetical protein
MSVIMFRYRWRVQIVKFFIVQISLYHFYFLLPGAKYNQYFISETSILLSLKRGGGEGGQIEFTPIEGR